MAQDRDNPPVNRGGKVIGIEKLNAAEIQLYLSGIDYPRSKMELVNYAKSKDAPEAVLNYLERIPEKPYTSPADVELEFRKLE